MMRQRQVSSQLCHFMCNNFASYFSEKKKLLSTFFRVIKVMLQGTLSLP